MKTKNILSLVFMVGLILLIPLYLTLTGSGVDGIGWYWTVTDFMFAFGLMFGTGLAYQYIASRTSNTKYRVIAGVGLLALFLVIWINAAVGLF